MSRILTGGDFYYNTPLTDFFNTIHFKSNEQRDEFFGQCIWKRFSLDLNFNVDKSKGELLITSKKDDFYKYQGLNYCRLIDNKQNKYFYYFIVKIEYINQNVVKLYLIIDTVMTYCQGKVLNNLKCLHIEREHLGKNDYMKMLSYLQKNDDILKTYSKKYSFENGLYFDEYVILILSSASLNGGFGNENNPKIIGSHGGVCDTVYSPLTLYMVYEKDFTTFINNLSNFPWVQQHIQKMILIPKIFINEKLFKKQSTDYFDGLYSVINSTNFEVNPELTKKLDEFSIDFNTLIKMLKIDTSELHLLRNEYVDVEIYNYNGSNLKIDVSDISSKYGLKFDVASVIGFENIVTFFLKNHKVADKELHFDGKIEGSTIRFKGTSLNNAITFSDFDNVPMSINVKDLSLSKNAHQRALQESRLFSGRVSNIMNGNDNTSKLYDAISLTSNISIANLFGRLNDEYNYYRDLKAQTEDKAIEPPTITQASNTNALTRNNHIYGMTLKIATLSDYELEKVKKYYKIMGYKVDKQLETLSDIECMNNINYVKFDGTFNLKNVDTAHNEILKQIFANGVRLWHYNDSYGNDFEFSVDKILSNEWR